MTVVRSPFDAPAQRLRTLPTREVAARYFAKCGLDISPWLAGQSELDLFECERTGMRFWRPCEAAGDEAFYRALSAAWPGYYRQERWEYATARRWLSPADRVLEVGCGRGWFLKSIEGQVASASGLELNREAIADRVTRFDVRAETLGAHVGVHAGTYSCVCVFHVLEHVINPAEFLRQCVELLQPGGLLVVSTPNYASNTFRDGRDPFDMPPHHMNHFDATVYRRIASIMGLRVQEVRQQPRYADASLQGTGKSASWAWLRALALSASYRLSRSPGDSIVVALRK